MTDKPREPDSATVIYDVRDLLEGLDTKMTNGLAEIRALIATKADHGEVSRLADRINTHATRLDDHETRIGAVEQDQQMRRKAAEVHQQRDARFSKRVKATWAAISLGLIVAATFLGPSAHIFGH